MSYEQIVYNRCRQNGFTEAAALAFVGNCKAESGCEPFRLQGDFSPYRTMSKSYVAGVTNGSISRDTFGRDAKGFGLYQLTYFTRKLGFYDYWKTSGKALDDAELQVDYATIELERDFPNLLNYLKTTNDLFTATSRICREFERPAYNNIDARFLSAKVAMSELDLDSWETDEPEEPDTTPEVPSGYEKIPATEYFPPRTIDRNMTGDDVLMLQAILIARGFYDGDVSGEFNQDLEKSVKAYQDAYNLDCDGIVGRKTWTSLFTCEW